MSWRVLAIWKKQLRLKKGKGRGKKGGRGKRGGKRSRNRSSAASATNFVGVLPSQVNALRPPLPGDSTPGDQLALFKPHIREFIAESKIPEERVRLIHELSKDSDNLIGPLQPVQRAEAAQRFRTIGGITCDTGVIADSGAAMCVADERTYHELTGTVDNGAPALNVVMANGQCDVMTKSNGLAP